MLHRRHIALWNRIYDVADEKVPLRMTIRQERRAVFRHFTHHNPIFVTSHTVVNFRHFTHQANLWISIRSFRHFTHQLSSLHTPTFVTSHTGPSEKTFLIKNLRYLIHSVTLSLTYFLTLRGHAQRCPSFVVSVTPVRHFTHRRAVAREDQPSAIPGSAPPTAALRALPAPFKRSPCLRLRTTI